MLRTYYPRRALPWPVYPLEVFNHPIELGPAWPGSEAVPRFKIPTTCAPSNAQFRRAWNPAFSRIKRGTRVRSRSSKIQNRVGPRITRSFCIAVLPPWDAFTRQWLARMPSVLVRPIDGNYSLRKSRLRTGAVGTENCKAPAEMRAAGRSDHLYFRDLVGKPCRHGS